MQDAPLHEAVARAPDGGRAFWLRADDGVRLRLATWPGPKAVRGTVFLLTGRGEYIEKYGPAAGELGARGYGMVTLDWRGQGLSDRLLADPLKGHVGQFADYQRDLAAALVAAETLALPRPWFLLAHSMGGTIALRQLAGAHPFRAVALSAPMWGIALPPGTSPFAGQAARNLTRWGRGERYAPSTGPVTYVFKDGFSVNRLTSDPGMWAFMIEQLARAPELTVAGPTVHWLAEALAECASLLRLPAPDLPCYCAHGTNEHVVEPSAIRKRLSGWTGAQLEVVEGARHELMMESPAIRRGFYDACAALFDRVA